MSLALTSQERVGETMITIAIQPDLIVQPNGVRQSYSDRWMELAAAEGIEARRVDLYEPNPLSQLVGCDGLMWRFKFTAPERPFAKRLVQAVEHGLGIPVFPSMRTAWHFEDKIAQHYLLEAAGIPMARTWVFWKRADAEAFCETANYPLVLKLSTGYRSSNVRLLHTREEARHWVRQLFGPGVYELGKQTPTGPIGRTWQRSRARLKTMLARGADRNELQQGYVYFQEFLPGNDFDTRVTVIGDRAFAYRRLNRPNDFRASGSGRPVWDPAEIDTQFVRLAFQIAQRLGTQSVAIDGLKRGREHLIGEISYTYVSWMVRECPGHWRLHGGPESGRLEWEAGHMLPDDAIFHDFVHEVREARMNARQRAADVA
jgi:glutathione synthase/RimK-type ligase-like ATP-grasp enzyme